LNAAENVRYAGCDFSEEMVEEAKTMNLAHVQARKAEFYHGSIENMPFDDSTFTKVFTVNTLYFWEDYERTLAEIRRVLISGGKLLIAIRPKQIMQAIPVCQHGFRLFDGEEVRVMLEQNGFKDISLFEAKEPDQEWEDGALEMATLVIQANVAK
jgi:SAM-dependent methyltransferase